MKTLVSFAPSIVPPAKQSSTAPAPAAPPSKTPASSARWIDMQQLVGRCLGNLELADRLITRFSERLATTTGEIEAAVSRKDVAVVESLAHRLKGEAGNMGAEALARLASRTEEYARLGFVAETVAAAEELVSGCHTFQEQARAFSLLAGQDRNSQL